MGTSGESQADDGLRGSVKIATLNRHSIFTLVQVDRREKLASQSIRGWIDLSVGVAVGL